MANCPECENGLDIELDEVEEGDVVACDECGTEYEVVGVEPVSYTHLDVYKRQRMDLTSNWTKSKKATWLRAMNAARSTRWWV